MRVLVALGGNAMTSAEGGARPDDQIEAATRAATGVADLAAAGHDVLLTHGNGPQVGNLLVKNELAAAVVPPVPLDWCGAQTQATLGYVLMNALDKALLDRGVDRATAAVVTRVLVRGEDPGWSHPTKPIGRYLPAAEALVLVEHGETWHDFGDRGWRRVVASPEPLEIVDLAPVRALADAGFLVVACGGGGIPVVRDDDGRLGGVEAVIDKDLSAALLAEAVGADVLLIATDVPHALVGRGTPQERPLGQVDVATLREYAAAGEFGEGSMGPKVEAALRFVGRTGRLAVICALDQIVPAVAGLVGTVVTRDDGG